ncbi:beta-propeller domain-containing protein [Geosporobacter ferrireducens]|uniref:Beta propeller domain-containing protein n=1 Tax=Geosporobacter ferrireducens TaxID=1424294 RepID=A0A1D8GE87_9FIRM|nr:beta-propeller domain-containing protein [Geosporobacter ferrireducens]AOT69227.1 hypothetical protein Gferi_06400 [Geosporobacter ferrireducens]MTI56907.1 hypothetical protein [Geosporobacter ferrireducens]
MKKKGQMLVLILLAFSLLVAYGYTHNRIVSIAEEPPTQLEALPRVGSQENLRSLLKTYYERESLLYGNMMKTADGGSRGMESVTVELEAQAAVANDAAGDYSTTNVQVQGVDEADLVKTDGKYIYQINGASLVIVDAQQPEKMKVSSRVSFKEEQFRPLEMYLDQDYLILIGHTPMPIGIPKPMIQDSVDSTVQKIRPMPVYYGGSTVYIKVYDIKDRSGVKLEREIKMEGNYLSSRKIKDSLYLVANHPIHYYIMENKESEVPTPRYQDTLLGEEIKTAAFEDIRYFPNAVEPNYITLLGLNLKTFKEKANIDTYLGQGENIYASSENLYIAVNRYEFEQSLDKPQNQVEGTAGFRKILPGYSHNTEVYCFGLKDGEFRYTAKGKVPGRILNQFSMDEYEEHFRIATTTGEMWRSDEFTSKNNVYVLDGQMKTVGSLEGIAPGERIYSMRFMGNKGYMVTFRETDPFFVLDLKEPKEPKMLGYLKIPGYSDYLHPYDENHIIGFGKEVIEVKGAALQAGMKVAVFDVRDVSQPIEKFKTVIGDRGTESSLLQNHKALLFSKEKNLMAFPLTVIENKRVQQDPWSSGEFTFQGAYVYQLDMEKGLSLRDRITHLTPEDYMKAGQHWYESDLNVQRILYIGDILYTLSNQKIMAHDLKTLKLKGSLTL